MPVLRRLGWAERSSGIAEFFECQNSVSRLDQIRVRIEARIQKGDCDSVSRQLRISIQPNRCWDDRKPVLNV